MDRRNRSPGWPALAMLARTASDGSVMVVALARVEKRECNLRFYIVLRPEVLVRRGEFAGEIQRTVARQFERATEKVNLFDADDMGFRFLEENSNEEG
jgi:hypothetical protein